jgi:polysaccharide pyruvyl transferase WcaK-like protein
MKKLMVISHYNLNNGDRAVLEGTLQILKDNGVKKVNLSVVDKDSFKTSIKDIEVTAVPWGIKFSSKLGKKIFTKLLSGLSFENVKKYAGMIYNRDYLKAVEESDIVLVSGGHHLTDIVGDEAFYRLSFDMLYPLIIGKKLVLLPQTIGPFKNPNSNKVRILKFILEKAEYTAVRDNNSIEFIKSNKITPEKVEIMPDMVFGLYKVLMDNKEEKLPNSIGIALYGNYSGKDAPERVRKYLDELIGAIDDIDSKWKINFLPMEVKGTPGDDRKLITYIKEKVKDQSKINVLEEEGNIVSTIRNFSKNELIIAYKTHSVLFSLLQHIPVVAVAYHQKSIDFMQMYELKEYSIWDKDVTSDRLKNLIYSVEEGRDQIINKEEILTKEMYNTLKNFIIKNI